MSRFSNVADNVASRVPLLFRAVICMGGKPRDDAKGLPIASESHTGRVRGSELRGQRSERVMTETAAAGYRLSPSASRAPPADSVLAGGFVV